MSRFGTCKYADKCLELWSKTPESCKCVSALLHTCENCTRYVPDDEEVLSNRHKVPDFTNHTGEGPWIN